MTHVLTWEQFDLAVTMIAQIVQRDKYDGVYGVPRGGLILATALSHHLNLPLLAAPSDRSLVVDDIADTGRTLKGIRAQTRAVWVKRDGCSTGVDIHITMICDDQWVKFPWEVSDERDR